MARYYDDLIASLKEKRQLQLEAIDSLAWKQLEPYENRQRRLQDLEESYGTTTQLCQILTGDSKDVTDTVVIELAEHVEKKIQELSNDLQRDTQPAVPRAKIMVDYESLAATKEKMLSLVRVYESPVVDIEKCSIIMPDDVIVGEDNTIKIDLFDHTKRPIPASNTAANVTATVVSPSGKRDVIVVARDTDISLTQIRMSDTQPVVPRAKIMVDYESLAATKEKMLSLVRVYESTDVDIEKCSVIMPDDFIVGADNTIKIDLFDHTKRPIPASNTAANVTATVVSPSGKRDVIVVTRDPDISLTQIRMSLSVKPDGIGQHSLQVQSSGRAKTVNFSSCDPPVLRCDPQKCSSVITLSNDNRTARHTGQSYGYGTVTTAVGYTRGRHVWNVRFTQTKAGGFNLSAGVTALPRNGDYNGTWEYFDYHRYYGWLSTGEIHSSSGTGDLCEKLRHGDTATFVLDCDQKSLEIRVHRTNKTSKITGLQCDEPLHPALCLYAPNHQAEFY